MLGQRIIVPPKRVVPQHPLEQVLIRALRREREVVSALGINARGEPAAVRPGGEIRTCELRDSHLVRGEVGSG